jgi:hypothetical protein
MKTIVSKIPRTRNWSISIGCILAHTCIRVQYKHRIKLLHYTIFTLTLIHIKDVYTLSINFKKL